ncbi:hypothetical protein, partial [Sphingobium sp. BHU LFT2]|uniref:hypothetical protein n=1 Tax=Sphingobium sp. BHU LFT2 TaxID=2807634 RepID=UPI001BE79B33
SCYVGDRAWREPLVITASVEWHLGPSGEPVNSFLAKKEPKTKITAQRPTCMPWRLRYEADL